MHIFEAEVTFRLFGSRMGSDFKIIGCSHVLSRFYQLLIKQI